MLGPTADAPCTVTIHEASLGRADEFSAPDAYVLIELANRALRTATKDDTHQPVWEQSFDGLRYAETSQVKVTLWDLGSGFTGDDDRLGTAESHGGRWHLGGELARRFELWMGADALSLSIRCRMPG